MPRPRRAQDEVLRTTLDVLAERGVSGLSVDTVAERAGISKATIYRHWKSRAGLIHAAISSVQPEVATPETGTLRGDLIALLQLLLDYFDSPMIASIFPSLLDAAVRDPEYAALRQDTLRKGRAEFERAIGRAVKRGELPKRIDKRLLVDLVRAPVVYRRVVAQVPVTRREVEAIVDAVLRMFPPDATPKSL